MSLQSFHSVLPIPSIVIQKAGKLNLKLSYFSSHHALFLWTLPAFVFRLTRSCSDRWTPCSFVDGWPYSQHYQNQSSAHGSLSVPGRQRNSTTSEPDVQHRSSMYVETSCEQEFHHFICNTLLQFHSNSIQKRSSRTSTLVLFQFVMD